MYTCKRCNYSSLYKKCLMQHFNNKKPCKVILEDIDTKILIDELINKEYNNITHECIFCNKIFNCLSSVYRHKKTCKKKPIDIIDNITNRLDNLETINNKQQILIDELQKSKNTVNNVTANSQTININVKTKIKNLNYENMDALPVSFMSYLFMDLKFGELIENLHCDTNFPENHNVRIKSIKRKVIEIYRNDKWELMTYVNGLNELLLQGHKIFKDYYKNNKDKILEEDLEEYELNEILRTLDNIENLNKNEIKPLHMELQLMLEENKNRLVKLI